MNHAMTSGQTFLTGEVTLEHESSNLFQNNTYEAYLIYFSLPASLLYHLYYFLPFAA
jgi:hypothetical protein